MAVIQMMPATGDCTANIARADRLVREAVLGHGAGLVLLPECGLTGYAAPPWPGDPIAMSGDPGRRTGPIPGPPVEGGQGPGRTVTLQEAQALAETVPGPSVDHFAALAAELKAYIVWTLPERRGGEYYNSAVLLSPGGTVMGTYSKVHINKYEAHAGWTNGKRYFVWPCRVQGTTFNLGIMICFDREVPEAARCLTVLGADLIAIPQAAYCTCDIPIHRDQLRVRAYENEVYLAMANWAGPEFKGHSMIVDPCGEIMRIGGREEEILSATLDMRALAEHRANGIYGRHHRQPSAYGPLLAM
jgi:predicted amidohydrolase